MYDEDTPRTGVFFGAEEHVEHDYTAEIELLIHHLHLNHFARRRSNTSAIHRSQRELCHFVSHNPPPSHTSK